MLPPRHSSFSKTKKQTNSPNFDLPVNSKIQVLKALEFNLQLCETSQQTSIKQCKFCLLKQRFATSTSHNKCLEHSFQNQKNQITDNTSKAKQHKIQAQIISKSYRNDEDLLEQKTMERLEGLLKQVQLLLLSINNTVDWLKYPQLLNTIQRCFRCLPNFQKSHDQITKCLEVEENNQQSSVQFQLSFDTSVKKIQTDDLLINKLQILKEQAEHNSFISSEMLLQIIDQIEFKLIEIQESKRLNELKIEHLEKKCTSKVSTSDTLKYYQDVNMTENSKDFGDINFSFSKQKPVIEQTKNSLLIKTVGWIQGSSLQSALLD